VTGSGDNITRIYDSKDKFKLIKELKEAKDAVNYF